MTKQLRRIALIASVLVTVCSGWVSSPLHLKSRNSIQKTSSFLSLSPPGASKEFENKVASVASGELQDDDILSAAAAVTQEKYQLIGIKSLGVDYGLARTGLATTIGYNPEPLEIIQEYNSTLLAREVVQIAASMQAAQIILGLPLHKNGTEQEQSILTRQFGQELAALAMARLGPTVKVMLWDERYTSREAAARVQSEDPDRWVQGTLDAECACIILETYYNENGEGAEQIEITGGQKTACLEIFEQIKEFEVGQRQTVMDERERRIEKRKESIAKAKKLEEEMRANGTLGVSNKKKKKNKKKQAKKKTNWVAPE